MCVLSRIAKSASVFSDVCVSTDILKQVTVTTLDYMFVDVKQL